MNCMSVCYVSAESCNALCTGHDEMREVRGGTKSNVRSASKPLLNVSAMKTILEKIQTLLSSLLEEPVV